MIIDGKKIAEEIQEGIKQELQRLAFRPPCLAALLVGAHPASQIYVKRKMQACAAVGIRSLKCEFPESLSESDLLGQIERLNKDPEVDGILVQFPLPRHIDSVRVTHQIDPAKDVDGFHPYNMGRMLMGETDGFFPCTPLGIKKLLECSSIDLTGKHALVVGRSNIVGKPMAMLLMQKGGGGNATVTVAHRHTANLKELALMADLIVAAIGHPHFITAEMVKEGAVVIDVGINRQSDGASKKGYRLVGDVDFERVAPKCSFITPVPGGVGPMTIAMLLQNTWLGYQKRILGAARGV